MAYCLVLVTASSQEEADKLTQILIQGRLAACVNQVPGVKSVYWWKGRVEEARETLLLVKTVKTKVKEIVRAVKKNHSYSVPEVLALPVKEGNRDYLKWITESLEKPAE